MLVRCGDIWWWWWRFFKHHYNFTKHQELYRSSSPTRLWKLHASARICWKTLKVVLAVIHNSLKASSTRTLIHDDLNISTAWPPQPPALIPQHRGDTRGPAHIYSNIWPSFQGGARAPWFNGQVKLFPRVSWKDDCSIRQKATSRRQEM